MRPNSRAKYTGRIAAEGWEPVALVDFLHKYAKNPRLLGSFMQFAGYKNSLS
jgi:hypothetical protein